MIKCTAEQLYWMSELSMTEGSTEAEVRSAEIYSLNVIRDIKRISSASDAKKREFTVSSCNYI